MLINGKPLAILKRSLVKIKTENIDIIVGDTKVTLHYDLSLNTVEIFAPKKIPVTDVYWFAWYANHPNTQVWQ